MKIVFSAGELSGDEHGAKVLEALRRFHPEGVYLGMGGRNLCSAGLKLVVDAEKSASRMGFLELFGGLGKIVGAYQQMKNLLRKERPDLLLLINFSEFNLLLSKVSKKLGIRTIFYIPPTVWAWRARRIRTMQKTVDAALVIFPFERAFYESHGFHRAVYVGHPFADGMSTLSREGGRSLLAQHGLDPMRPVVALFPGSRGKEVKAHLPLLLDAFKQVKANHPEIQGFVAVAPNQHRAEIEKEVKGITDLVILSGEDPFLLLKGADAGIIKAGTSNLQAAAVGLPFVMVYKASPLSAWIVQQFSKLTQYSMVNILRPTTIRELLQEEATAEHAAEEVTKLLFNKSYRDHVGAGIAEVQSLLQGHDSHPTFRTASSVPERVASFILQTK